MPQTTDIILNGAGYMIDPGTATSPGYRRLQDGFPEGRTERTTITDFIGGTHRHLQLERDKLGDSIGIGPVLGGQGVRPWPRIPSIGTMAAMAALDKPSRLKRIPQVICEDKVYIAIGKSLYRHYATDGVGPAATGHLQLLKTYANPITDMCLYGHTGILLCFGSAADILYWNTLTSTDTPLFAGERGFFIAPYAGYAIWSDARTASRPTVMRQVTGVGIETRRIDNEPVGLAIADAALYVITKGALYSYSGRVRDQMVTNPPTPWVAPNPHRSRVRSGAVTTPRSTSRVSTPSQTTSACSLALATASSPG